MKKGLIFIFFVFIFYGCKSYNSDTSSLIETDRMNTYLFGASTAKDGSSIICRFDCSSIPTQDNKNTVCSSPVYIEESIVKNSKELSKFLEDIQDSKELFTREILPNEKEKLSSLFTVEASRISRGVYNTRLGNPEEVCSSVMDFNNKTRLIAISTRSTRKDITLIDLVTCPILIESIDSTVFIIPKSWDVCVNNELLEQAGLKLEYKALKKLSEEVYTINNEQYVINYSQKFQTIKEAYQHGRSDVDFSSYNIIYYGTNYQDGPYIHSPIKDTFLLMVCPFNQDYTKVLTPECYRYLYDF